MAIGFTPKYVESYVLNELTKEQGLALLYAAVKEMQLEIGFVSEDGLIAFTNKGMFSRNSEIKLRMEEGTVNIVSASVGSEMVDWGLNKKNVKQLIENIKKAQEQYSAEQLDESYAKLKDEFVYGEDDVLRTSPLTARENINSFIGIFKPVEGYFVTPILVNLNILVFILMAISGADIFLPENDLLIGWGANFRPETLDGQWWRLITSCFLHIGIIHLLMNMYALVYIGLLLEPHLGKTRFAVAYLFTGIASSVCSLWWHDMTISAGASGAIFGMYGVFLAMLTTNLFDKSARKPLLISMAVFIAYNLMYGMKAGVDNAAHIGGLISGLVIGYAFVPSLRAQEEADEERITLTTIILLSVLVLGSSWAVYKMLPNDMAVYMQKMEEFTNKESLALEVFKLPETASEERVMSELKERGMYYWNENIKLLDELKDLDLPEVIRARNLILREYCELRLQSYELMYKAISEHTDQYDEALQNCNKLVEAKINSLTK